MAKLKTGRHTSALKENRSAIKRATRNKAVRSKISNIVRKVEAAVTAKDKTAASSLLKTRLFRMGQGIKERYYPR